ncbi:MAG: hypothetical protein ACXV2E_06015 [Halobacteriota archaeon]
MAASLSAAGCINPSPTPTSAGPSAHGAGTVFYEDQNQMLKPATYQFDIFVDKEVKTTKGTIIAFILIGVISLSLVNVASANSVANAQTIASTQTTSLIRVASISGTPGNVIVDNQTGWFWCLAYVGHPGTTVHLQYHVTGIISGAKVIGSGKASPMGTVVIVGKLSGRQLGYISQPGEFIIGPFVI